MAKITSVVIHDFSDQVIREMRSSVQAALKAIGQEAEGYAKKECPVDSGRLRNSIAWATTDAHGSKKMSGDKGQEGDDKPQGTPEENSVYVGTNVEYAPMIEFRDMSHKVGRAHFLRDSMTTHAEHYKEILEAKLRAD